MTIKKILLILGLMHAFLTPARAADADEAPDRIAYKFTAGLYRLSDLTTGTDLNLRQTSKLGNAWIGLFHLPDGSGMQWRAGWDHSYGEKLRFSPSVQIASGGFAGSSVQIETGDPWYVGAGLGRTNLRPYYNLNFDPNDALMFSAGWRPADKRSIGFQYIRDNRENPDQRHLHLTWRQPMPESQRLTVDVLYKSGLVNQQSIHRIGLSLGYDWRQAFVKLTWDPNTNFTPENSLRLQTGLHF